MERLPGERPPAGSAHFRATGTGDDDHAGDGASGRAIRPIPLPPCFAHFETAPPHRLVRFSFPIEPVPSAQRALVELIA